MTDFEQKVLDELASLRRVVESLQSEFSVAQLTYFENLSPAAVVGVDYVAFRFHCSQEAVIRGRFDTDKIPRLRNKPLAFIKRNVDAVWQNLNQSTEEKAAKYRQKANNVMEKNRK